MPACHSLPARPCVGLGTVAMRVRNKELLMVCVCPAPALAGHLRSGEHERQAACAQPPERACGLLHAPRGERAPQCCCARVCLRLALPTSVGAGHVMPARASAACITYSRRAGPPCVRGAAHPALHMPQGLPEGRMRWLASSCPHGRLPGSVRVAVRPSQGMPKTHET